MLSGPLEKSCFSGLQENFCFLAQDMKLQIPSLLRFEDCLLWMDRGNLYIKATDMLLQRNIWRSLVQSPTSSRSIANVGQISHGFDQPSFLDRGFTTSLGSLCHLCITQQSRIFLMSNWRLSSNNLWSLLLVTLSATHEKSLAHHCLCNCPSCTLDLFSSD